MSYVTGVLLCIGLGEAYDELDDGSDRFALIEQLNAWLAERGFRPLAQIDNHFGGTKHPQMAVFGAGYNYLPDDEFLSAARSLAWKRPEDWLLILNPEADPPAVYRLGEV